MRRAHGKRPFGAFSPAPMRHSYAPTSHMPAHSGMDCTACERGPHCSRCGISATMQEAAMPAAGPLTANPTVWTPGIPKLGSTTLRSRGISMPGYQVPPQQNTHKEKGHSCLHRPHPPAPGTLCRSLHRAHPRLWRLPPPPFAMQALPPTSSAPGSAVASPTDSPTSGMGGLNPLQPKPPPTALGPPPGSRGGARVPSMLGPERSPASLGERRPRSSNDAGSLWDPCDPSLPPWMPGVRARGHGWSQDTALG